jgi:arginyl-tRNA synthetase
MKTAPNPLFLKMASWLTPIIHELGARELTVDEVAQNFQEAPQIELGQYAFAAFPLARTLKKGPPQIALALEESLIKLAPQGLKKAKATGPYLNLSLEPDFLGTSVLHSMLKGDFFKTSLITTPTKTMIEYSQPNTHKVLHVGHMRNLCLGNALIRMLRYAGEDVLAVTYPGDMGTHVAKTLWYMHYHCKESAPAEHRGAWLGELYVKATHKLEDELGSEQEATNRSQLTEILKELEAENGKFFELWKETRQWSLELMNEVYSWADVSFDRWFFESEFDAPSLKLMKEYLAQGLLKEDQGAVGMDLSDDKLGFCLLIKSDGTGLYATKDVALAKKKFEEFNIERNVYIVDNRQARHFQQVFKVLEKIGFEQAQHCYHLQYDVVELPDGAMSSRKGNIVPLMTLVHTMEKTITERYLERYRGEWSDEEIVKTAHQVASGAIKYGMIRIDNNRKIVFDMDEWLKLDGETGPYLQYVHARISSMLNKFSIENTFDSSLLTHPCEEKLMVKLSTFNDVVAFSVKNMKTVSLCAYLFDLGKLFNQFYAECPVGKADNEALKQARLNLAKATGLAMKQGLALLGIEAPSRM